jgi:DNA invertase Pin-like site-specific DNA recombinase
MIQYELIIEQILAEAESHRRKQISLRTKAALQSAKRRGVLLGSARPGHWNGREHLRLLGLQKARVEAAKSHRAAAREAYVDIAPLCIALRSEGYTLQKITDKLNRDGHNTRRNKPWNRVQVLRILRMFT